MSKRLKLRLITSIILFLGALFSVYLLFQEDKEGILTIAFLNIGQGDAILTVWTLFILSSLESGSRT